MAKQPTKKERDEYIKSILSSIPDDRIDTLIENQEEQLKTSEELLKLSKQDRLIQIGQSIGEYKILQQEEKIASDENKIFEDEEQIKKTLSSIDDNLKKLVDKIIKNSGSGITGLSSSNISNVEPFNQESASKLIQTSEYANQDKASEKLEKKNRSAATKTLDFFDKTGIVKRGSTGFFSQMYGLPELAKQEEKEKYITREKELGSQETDEKLAVNFNELQTAQRKKSLAETQIESTKKNLNLNDEQVAQTNTGRELLAQITKLDDLIGTLDSTISGKKEGPIQQIPELSKNDNTPNDTDHETQIEQEKVNEEQTSLLEKIEENTRPKDIPEQPQTTTAQQVTPAPQVTPAQSQSPSIIDTAMAAVGSGGIKKAGQAVLGIGKKALSMGGSLLKGAARFAGPIGVAVTAGEALHEGAKMFADSFGEGGFDLIQKLRKSDAISYGWGTTPHVDDWKQIEDLPIQDLKTLVDSKEFEGEDLQKIQQIIETKTNQGENKGSEKGVEAKVEPNSTQVTNTPVSGTDYVIKPNTENASQVYNQSAENASQATAPAATNNTVVAPTTVNNNSTTQQSIRLPVRNDDSTIRRYVSSRFTK